MEWSWWRSPFLLHQPSSGLHIYFSVALWNLATDIASTNALG
ncbi:MAG: hypothetical protein ACOVQ7_19750 [Limnoraphis robusta]